MRKKIEDIGLILTTAMAAAVASPPGCPGVARLSRLPFIASQMRGPVRMLLLLLQLPAMDSTGENKEALGRPQAPAPTLN